MYYIMWKREETIELFMKDLEKQRGIVEFDKNIWLSMFEYLTFHRDGRIEFAFLDGSRLK